MSHNLREYRRILGVDESAGIKELRKAFHVRASLFHPDVRRNDPKADEEFKRITTAYHHLKKEILKANREKKDAVEIPKPIADAHRPSASSAGENDKKIAALPGSLVPHEELVYRLRFSQNRYVRIHAMLEMVRQGKKSALWWVTGALKDHDAEVRRAAVHALGDIGSAVALVPLRELYRRADSFLRDEIEDSVKKIQKKIEKEEKPQPLYGSAGVPPA